MALHEQPADPGREFAPASAVQVNLMRWLEGTGPIRQRDLARERNVSESAISQAVKRLVRAGMVKREPDPSDKRCKLVSLTADGLLMASWPRLVDPCKLRKILRRAGAPLRHRIRKCLMVLTGVAEGMDLWPDAREQDALLLGAGLPRSCWHSDNWIGWKRGGSTKCRPPNGGRWSCEHMQRKDRLGWPPRPP